MECLSKLMTTVGNLLDHSTRMQRFHTAQGQEKMVSPKQLMDVGFSVEAQERWNFVVKWLWQHNTTSLLTITAPHNYVSADVLPEDLAAVAEQGS